MIQQHDNEQQVKKTKPTLSRQKTNNMVGGTVKNTIWMRTYSFGKIIVDHCSNCWAKCFYQTHTGNLFGKTLSTAFINYALAKTLQIIWRLFYEKSLLKFFVGGLLTRFQWKKSLQNACGKSLFKKIQKHHRERLLTKWWQENSTKGLWRFLSTRFMGGNGGFLGMTSVKTLFTKSLWEISRGRFLAKSMCENSWEHPCKDLHTGLVTRSLYAF